MRNRLNGLRHDLVVGGDHDDHDVGDLRTAGTHGGERLVTGGIEERDGALAGHLHVIGTDVLRDASGFAGNHGRLADVVEQRRLAVIDVSHDGHDGRT